MPINHQRYILPAGEKLDPLLLSDLEARFDAGLGAVRIHAGPAAGRLCRALQARAFTWGNDIYFSQGAYAPHTPAGRLLLAHELVHVLQQRAAGQTARVSEPVVLGDPQDLCEREADRLAAEAMAGRRRSTVTADPSRAIRRQVALLEASATLATSYDGARPGIQYVNRGNSDFAVLHLTRNKGPIIRGNWTNPAATSAIRITGTVLVAASANENTRDYWEFHFIQLFFLLAFKASYAGQSRADGSMYLDFAGPMHFGGYGKFVLDADPNNPASMPYAETYSGLRSFGPGVWQATVIIDDHPFSDTPLALPNPAAGNRNNYLYRVSRQFHVITTLVAVDRKAAAIRPLAWVEWGGLCIARLRWGLDGSGDPVVDPAVIESSYFQAWDAQLGPPPHRGAADVIKHPPSDPDQTYNSLKQASFNAIVRASSSKVDSLDVKTYGPSDPYSPPPDHFAVQAAGH